jgi:hypothetical protein
MRGTVAPWVAHMTGATARAFSRRVVLYEVHGTEGQEEKAVLGEALLYRLQIEDEALSGESRVLPVGRGHSGELVLEIHDGDSPPLSNLSALASAPATRLLFPAFSGPLTLYYGNEATRGPAYDLETLKGRIGLAPCTRWRLWDRRWRTLATKSRPPYPSPPPAVPPWRSPAGRRPAPSPSPATRTSTP